MGRKNLPPSPPPPHNCFLDVVESSMVCMSAFLKFLGIYRTVIIHNKGYLGFVYLHDDVSIPKIRTIRTDRVMYSRVVRIV